MVTNDLPIYGYLVTVAELQSLLFGVMDSKQGLSGKFINMELGWLYFRSKHGMSVTVTYNGGEACPAVQVLVGPLFQEGSKYFSANQKSNALLPEYALGILRKFEGRVNSEE